MPIENRSNADTWTLSCGWCRDCSLGIVTFQDGSFSDARQDLVLWEAMVLAKRPARVRWERLATGALSREAFAQAVVTPV